MPPPTSARTTDSIRNCNMMSPRLAPIDLRMPISRVRSVTVTSMMFMMPMPATISATAPMARETDAGDVENVFEMPI